MPSLKHIWAASFAIWASLVPTFAFADDGKAADTALVALVSFASFFLFGLLAAAYFVHRTGRRRPGHSSVENAIASIHRPELLSARRQTPEHGVAAVRLHEPDVADILLPDETGSKTCPECSRTFDETLVICPYDASPLLRISDIKPTSVDTGSRLPTCPKCKRVYEEGAQYCREDGSVLESGRVLEVLAVDVCRACGAESAYTLEECCDSPEISRVDPAEPGFSACVFPMNTCPCCHAMYPSNEIHCAEDGALLRPVTNLRFAALAPLGVGPRRKICQKCGSKYSSAAKHCAHDGELLITLN